MEQRIQKEYFTVLLLLTTAQNHTVPFSKGKAKTDNKVRKIKPDIKRVKTQSRISLQANIYKERIVQTW